MMLLQIQELQQKLQHAQSQAAHKEASQGELQERAQKAQESLEVQLVSDSHSHTSYMFTYSLIGALVRDGAACVALLALQPTQRQAVHCQ